MSGIPIVTSSFYFPAFRPVEGRIAVDPVGRVRRVVGESQVERTRVTDASAQVEISQEARNLARAAGAAPTASTGNAPATRGGEGARSTVAGDATEAAAASLGPSPKAATSGPVLDDRVRRAFRNRGTASRVEFGAEGSAGESTAAGDESGVSPVGSELGRQGGRGEKGERTRRLQVPKDKAADGKELSERELRQVQELKNRDREVRAHEAAHMAAGGPYAGGATYTYQTGPDGRRYAIGGEVSIDTSPVEGDPDATLRKMESVQRAALAPAEPSAPDRAIAASAAARAQRIRASVGSDGEMDDEEAGELQQAMGMGTDDGTSRLAAPGSGEARLKPTGTEGSGAAVEAAMSPARRVEGVVELGSSASLESPAQAISLPGARLAEGGELSRGGGAGASTGMSDVEEAALTITPMGSELAEPAEAVRPSGPEQSSSRANLASESKPMAELALADTPSVSVWLAKATPSVPTWT